MVSLKLYQNIYIATGGKMRCQNRSEQCQKRNMVLPAKEDYFLSVNAQGRLMHIETPRELILSYGSTFEQHQTGNRGIGKSGIRTHGALKTHSRFRGALLKPLRHLSVTRKL